eukprot:403360874
MDYTEAETQRLWLLAGHVKKLSYCNSLITALYNKHPTLDKIETTFSPVNADGTCNYKIVDSTNLGIIPGSLADNFNFCYGDPSDPKVAWRNPHERQTVEIFGKILGIEDVSGYMTSGGSEANLAAIWWCKLNLTMVSRAKIGEFKERLLQLESVAQESKNFKEIYQTKKILKRLYQPILVCTAPPKTHSCIIKAAQVLEIKTLYIEPNEDGSMNTQSLRGRLAELKDQPYINFIVALNFGTTFGPAFDDVFEVRQVFDEMKNEEWRYAVHVDGAMYGPTLPILKQYGEKSRSITECGIDTFTISLWKFMGVQIPCGVALSTKSFTDKAFEDDNFIEYVQMQDKLALSGTRSGIAAASSLNVLKSLKMHEDLATLEKVVNYCLELTDYFVERLLEFFPKEQIHRKYFNIIFPKGLILDAFINEHMLMRYGADQLQAIMLVNVNRDLIDEFFEKVKTTQPVLNQ